VYSHSKESPREAKPLFLYSSPLSFEGEALPLGALAQRGDKGGEVDTPLYRCGKKAYNLQHEKKPCPIQILA